MTWRTAFREVLKLRHSLPDVENEYRLQEWLDKGEGVNGSWSRCGARDAIQYYEQVSGDIDELKKRSVKKLEKIDLHLNLNNNLKNALYISNPKITY
jgi:hypothetical protein